MSVRIREHIRSNVVGYVAVFIALSGTAYAVDGPLPGQNQSVRRTSSTARC
jgi:hypothetical protein